MGKFRFSWGSLAAGLDRGRLAAITLLLVEAVVVSSLVWPAQVRPASHSIASSAQGSSFGLETPSFQFESSSDDSSSKPNFYPYSVIPGGASSVGELRNAIANDSTVRAHYADFVVASTRVERLKAPQAFYVSYRIGNQIFWTKNALTIPAGETVLSDGSRMARTRCGNRLSAVPVAPVAKGEVAPEAMELPAGETPLATITAPVELPVTPSPLTEIASVPPIPTAASGPAGGIFLPLPPYIPVGLGGRSTPGTPTSPGSPGGPSGPPPGGGSSGTPPGAPPVPAPEPSALLMLGAGLAGILLRSRLR